MTTGKTNSENKYLAIKYFHIEENWSVRWMCRCLKISKAAYYKWLHREIPLQEQENQLIAQLIIEYDDHFNHVLGYRRMTGYINRLNNRNYCINRVHRIMKKLGISSVIRRKRAKYKRAKAEEFVENILKRDFYAKRPNEKWATDVTEFKWYEGERVHKLYLSAIIDLYDRSIVSYVLSSRNNNQLVFDTFDRAVAANPDARPIFHSDRGFQYTSRLFRMRLSSQGMLQSMSRVGRCIDNGPVEGFWGIVKTEMFYLQKDWTRQKLERAVKQYIYNYNNTRLQGRFGYRSPMEVRRSAMESDNPRQYPIEPNKRIEKFKAKYSA